MVRVKICCIKSVEEAQLALQRGASALGLVSAMPSGPGVIDEPTIRNIAEAVPASTDTFLLTSERTVAGIVAQHARTRTTTIQICDRLVDGKPGDIAAALPGVRIVSVIHVTGHASVDEAVEAEQGGAHALLLDSGTPDADKKELGGTGRRHDWSISRRIRDSVSIPLWLAGGLTPDNVAEAISTVRPHGLDLCSSVRTHDQLDATKLQRFFDAVAAAQ